MSINSETIVRTGESNAEVATGANHEGEDKYRPLFEEAWDATVLLDAEANFIFTRPRGTGFSTKTNTRKRFIRQTCF